MSVLYWRDQNRAQYSHCGMMSAEERGIIPFLNLLARFLSAQPRTLLACLSFHIYTRSQHKVLCMYFESRHHTMATLRRITRILLPELGVFIFPLLGHAACCLLIRPLSTELLPSHLVPNLYHCKGFLLPRICIFLCLISYSFSWFIPSAGLGPSGWQPCPLALKYINCSPWLGVICRLTQMSGLLCLLPHFLQD